MPSSATRSPPRTSSTARAISSSSARSFLVGRPWTDRYAIEDDESCQSQTLCAASHSFSRTKTGWVFPDWRQSIIVALSPIS